jgi:PIN domain nuclease of toxin-antitoxin system
MPGAVADTHAVVWYLLDSPRLSAPASAQFEKCQMTGATVGVSSMSIIEIIYLVEKGRIPPATLPLLEKRLTEPGALLEIIPISHAVASTVQQVPRAQVPELPDRVIAATALHLGVPLISRDSKIHLSSVDTIW